MAADLGFRKEEKIFLKTKSEIRTPPPSFPWLIPMVDL